MPGHLTIRFDTISREDYHACKIEHKTVVEAIDDPGPEDLDIEEEALLAQLIKLGISI